MTDAEHGLMLTGTHENSKRYTLEQLEAPRSIVAELRTWQPRRWWIAAATAAVTIVFVAIPTVLIPNPWFVREIPVTPWAWPVLLITSALAGLVAATYVARKDVTEKERGGALGATGAIVSFFAVGCPVCNKLVLIALGYTGALQFFEPLQPYLAGGSVVLLAVALAMRIRRERSCPLPRPKRPSCSAETEPQEQPI